MAQAQAQMLKDNFGREITYLRIAVTDLCNLRCVYCMPPEGVKCSPREEVLRFEEIQRLVRVATGLGVRRVRLTGGEPLARRDVLKFVAMLRELPGLEDISLTTNGTLLAPQARALRDAGLNRVNISLDTLRPERFASITRRGRLEDAWQGIEAALAAGLHPVKLNTVIARGWNDDELADLARLTLDMPVHVRFIELMALGETLGWQRQARVSVAEMRQGLSRAFGARLVPAVAGDGWVPPGNGPARYLRLEGARGSIGLISPVTEHFCAGCNRLRLSATGVLRPCLLSTREVDVKGPLRGGESDDELAEVFRRAVLAKPEMQEIPQLANDPSDRDPGRFMSQIGG